MNEEELLQFDLLAENRNHDNTVYEDSSGWAKLKNSASQSAIGKLVGYGSVEDKSGYDYGQGFFDAPKFLVEDGKRYGTSNKIFNDMNQEEVDNYITKNMVPSKNTSDRHFYKLRNPNTGEIKYGLATSEGVTERYKRDSGFQGWITEYDQPTANAEELENTIHGSKAMRDRKSYDYGKAGNAILNAGGTEIYKPRSQLQLKKKMQVEAVTKATDELDAEQGNILLDAWDGFKILNGMSDIDSKGRKVGGDDGRQRKDVFTENVKGTVNDLAMGASLGVDKGLGGITGLLNKATGGAFKEEQDFWKQRAKTNSDAMTTKDGIAATLGEVTPELIIPATLPIKGANLVKNIAVGATSGAGINYATEKIKDQSGIKQGMESSPKLAAGIGGVIGGIVGAVTKNPVLAKAIERAVKEGKTPEEAMKFYSVSKPNIRRVNEKVSEHIGNQTKKLKSTGVEQIKKIPTTTEVKVKTKVEKEVVKGKSEDTNVDQATKEATDKTGTKQKSEALAKQDQLTKTSTTKVVDPRIHVSKELDNQVAVPKTNEDLVGKIGWDFRHRTYDEKGSLINSQGGDEAKFSQAINERTAVSNADEEVSRIMKTYDNDASLRKEYGVTQTRLNPKKMKENSKAQEIANRNKFERDNYLEIANSKAMSPEVKANAKARAAELGKRKVVVPKTHELVKSTVRDKFNAQYEKEYPQEKLDLREEQIAKEQEGLNTKDLAHREKLNKRFESDPNNKILATSEKMLDDARGEMLEASKTVEDLANLQGKEYKEAEVDSQGKPYQNKIKEYKELEHDISAYKKGNISLIELRDRMKTRLSSEQMKNSKLSFKNFDEYKSWKETDDKLMDDLNIPRRELAVDKPRKETLGAKSEKQNDDGGLAESIHKHTARTKAIKKGTAKLTHFEKQVLKAGAKPEDVAMVSAPISKNVDTIATREKIVEKLTIDYNNKIRKSMGLPTYKAENTTQRIKPTDSTTDFSNSVGQNTALLTGDKDIGDFTKLTGTLEDLRSRIADIVSQRTGKLYTKNDIKPLFMQQMYGQMEKGLIKTVKGDEKLFKEYDKAMKEIFPSFSKFSEEIYKLGKNSKNGEFKYTLPDGVEVKFKLQGNLKGKIDTTDKTATQTTLLNTGEYDNFSRALAPNIMHSVDGYIIRTMVNRLGELGIDSRAIHDAITFRNEYTDVVKRIALEVQKDVLKSNMLDDIMRQLGYKGEPLKSSTVNKLTEADLEKSLGKAMDFEHIAGKIEKMHTRDMQNSKLLSKDEAMKEYMARNNVKLQGNGELTDAMVNEAGYNSAKYATARDSDDVYERAMASALQGKKLKLVKAPDELNGEAVKTWNRIQKDIIRETRAKTERNPMLRGVIQGERKFFNEKGKWMGSDKKSYNEMLVQEERLFRKAVSKMTVTKVKKINKAVKIYSKLIGMNGIERTMPNYKAALERVRRSAKTEEEQILKQEIEKVQEGIQSPNKWSEFKRFIKGQVSDDVISKDYNKLFERQKRATANAAEKASRLQEHLDKSIPFKERELYTQLFESDFVAIRDMNREQGRQCFKENFAIYKQAKPFIDKAAAALNKNGNKTGHYLNNPNLIAKEAGIPEDLAPTIDKLISLKAMTTEKWDFVESKKDSEIFKYVLDVIAENQRISRDVIFKTNPDGYIKGFTNEINDTGKTISKDGKEIWDAETKFQEGAIPTHKERQKIGTYTDRVTIPKTVKNKNDKYKWMEANQLKEGKDGTVRKVVTEELRNQVGKSNDFNRILSETYGGIQRKLEQRAVVEDILEELSKGESSVISRVFKKDMVKLTDKQRSKLPTSLQEQMQFVHKDLIAPLLGRDEPRLYKGDKQFLKIADRALNNTVTSFKKNVVLKNLPSYKNALIVNINIGLMTGVSPWKLVKYQKQSFPLAREASNLKNQIVKLQAAGKDTASIQKELQNNELYKMEQEGLSTNRVEGVRGSDSMIGSMIDAGTSKVGMKRIVNEITLNQSSTLGKATVSVFTDIDTMGRYTLAKHYVDKGMSMKDAVHKANGLFADMDRFVPAWIEAADKYGVPFLKWFALSTPQLLKVAKENPMKAFAIGAIIYQLGKATNTNFDSQNPVPAAMDFAEQTVTAPYDIANGMKEDGVTKTVGKKALPYVMPSVYKEAYKLATKPKYNVVWKDRQKKPYKKGYKDYRSVLQRTMEDNFN